MPETHEHPLSKAAESATLMTEWFWPPLAALRAMERWSSSGAMTLELPDTVARISERLESVEEHEGAIQDSVKPIDSKLLRLAKQGDALEQRVSDMDSALGAQRKELTALKQANAELERKSAPSAAVKSLRKELDALKQANADLERKSAPSAAVESLRKELDALKQANAELERKPRQSASASTSTEEGQNDEPTQAMKILGAGAGRDEGTKASPKERTAEAAKRPSPAPKSSAKTRS